MSAPIQLDELVKTLIDNEFVLNNWILFCDNLGLQTQQIVEWDRGIQNGTHGFYTVFKNIFTIWITESEDKSVGDLCAILRKIGAEDVADGFEESFHLDSIIVPNSTRLVDFAENFQTTEYTRLIPGIEDSNESSASAISVNSTTSHRNGFVKWILVILGLIVLAAMVLISVILFQNFPWRPNPDVNQCPTNTTGLAYAEVLSCLAIGVKIEGNAEEAWDGMKASSNQIICKLDNCTHSESKSRLNETFKDPSQVICKKDMMKRWELIPPKAQTEVSFRIPSSSKCIGVIGINQDDTGGECNIAVAQSQNEKGEDVDVTVTAFGEVWRGVHYVVLVIGHGDCYQIN